MRRAVTVAAVLAMAIVGLPTEPPIAGASDTLQSFTESPGCEALDGTKGPLMGPGPRVDWFNYASLPNSTEVLGPWGDYYGRTIGEVRDSLVVVNLPGQPKDLYIHERVLPAFNQAVANIEAYAPDGESYEIRSDTWSFNPAVIPGGRHLSFHGVGASLDINSLTNPYTSDPTDWTTDMPEWFVQAWKDAGWCWGGDWVSVKDPMHFAWMGPVHADFAEEAPYPADTTPSDFDDIVTTGTSFDTGFETAARFGIDINRDGAPDVLRVHESPETGAFRIEVAESWRNFETCTATNWSAFPGLDATDFTVGDFDADGRPELWLIDETGVDVRVAIYTMVNRDGGFSTVEGTPTLVDTITTGADPAAGGVFMVGDHDRDGFGDLYVVVPGATTTLQVWAGPTFTSTLVNRTLGFSADADWRFGLGDFDLDAIPDLYALSDAGPASLEIVDGGSDFATDTTETTGVTVAADETLAVEDFDGDGRDDLLLIDADGDFRVVLGGVRGAGADLTEWFVERDLSWNTGIGCLVPPPVTDILDAGFESGAKADSPHGFGRTGGGSWAITSGAAQSGTFGARYSATGQTETAVLEINGPRLDGSTHIWMLPGQVVGFSVATKADSSDSNRIRPRINYYDDAGRYIDGVATNAIRPHTSWQEVAVVGVIPPGTAFATFEIRVHADGMGGTYSFDDLALLGPTVPVAEIANQGLESGSLAPHLTDAGWSIDETTVRTGAYAASFDAAAQVEIATLTLNGAPDDPMTHIPIAEDELIGFTAWVRSNGPTSSNRMRPRVVFYDRKGRFLDAVSPQAASPTETWQQVSVAGLAPIGSAYAVLQVRVHPDGSGGTYAVDDLELIGVSSVPGTVRDAGFESGGLAEYDNRAAGGIWSVSGAASRSGANGATYDPIGQTGTAVIAANGPRRDIDHVAVTPGEMIGFSAWVSASADANTNRVRPRIHFYDADWTYLVGQTMGVVTPTTAWQRIQIGTLVPDDAAFAVFQIRVHDDGNPATILIDDLAPATAP